MVGNLAVVHEAVHSPSIEALHRAYLSPRRWHAVTVHPLKERVAADWLKQRGIWAYWPNYVRQVAAGGKGKSRRRPKWCAIIPGYLFVAFRSDMSGDPWVIVHDTPGVHGFVCRAANEPALMTDTDIEIIRRIEGGLNLPLPAHQVRGWKIGDKVRFVDDLWSRWPAGVVARLAEDSRISVEVAVLGRVVPVLVFPHQIEAI